MIETVYLRPSALGVVAPQARDRIMILPTRLLLLLASTVTAVLLPSQDAFYTQPANISSYAPGDVINSRSIPTNLNGLLSGGPSPSIKAAYQYLYRTNDSLGNAIAAVTTLLVPYGADPSKLLAYQTAYDSANNDCSPSYAFQAGANTSATSDIIFVCIQIQCARFTVLTRC